MNGDIPADSEFEASQLRQVSHRADRQGPDRARLGMAAVHVRLGPREKFRFHVHYLKATVDNMRRKAMGRFYKESIREGSSVVFVVTTVPGSESGEPSTRLG